MRNPVLNYLRRLSILDDTPERIALAFAVGVFLAFSPLLGLHTFLGIVLAFVFGLNRMAVLVGLFVNNPWTLVPIYALATYVGGLLIGFPSTVSLPQFDWSGIWERSFWIELARGWRLLMPLVVGCVVLSSVGSIGSYVLALLVIRQRRLRSPAP